MDAWPPLNWEKELFKYVHYMICIGISMTSRMNHNVDESINDDIDSSKYS